jgi:UDP-N-acetylglucosamine 2-epimerase (non-hydrolysing)
MRVMVVYGTRPEAVKLAPVVQRLRRSRSLEPVVCTTGQHLQLVSTVHALFGIAADLELPVIEPSREPTLTEGVARIVAGIGERLRAARPAAVLVQGDTTSAFAAALAAFYERIPVAHVEAGLRTGQLTSPFPEEAHRAMTSKLARWHFAPTPDARAALLREGIDEHLVLVTGNTVVDALEAIRPHLPPLSDAMHGLGAPLGVHERLVLVTAHRRESFGAPLRRLCHAIEAMTRLVPDLRVVWPVHPNPEVRSVVYGALAGCASVTLTEPLSYPRFLALLRGAWLTLSDSGGVQEEAPCLGAPLLVLRDITERREALASGNARLVGSDGATLLAEVTRLVAEPAERQALASPRALYGDGQASARIVERLERDLGKGG